MGTKLKRLEVVALPSLSRNSPNIAWQLSSKWDTAAIVIEYIWNKNVCLYVGVWFQYPASFSMHCSDSAYIKKAIFQHCRLYNVEVLFKCFTQCWATHTKNPLGAIARLTLGFSPLPKVLYIGRIGIFVALRACNWQFHIQLCTPPADTFEGGNRILWHPPSPCWPWGVFQNEQGICIVDL